MADIITKDSEEFKELTGWIKRTGKNLEAAAARIRPTIADEHYLSGDEVCRMLHVSKRTLQTLRDEKAIPYTSITSSASEPSTTFALCVTIIICLSFFFRLMNGIRSLKTERLSKSSSG